MCETTERYASIISKFIKEVGFPVFAYLLLFYLCVITIQENTAAIEQLTSVIEGMD